MTGLDADRHARAGALATRLLDDPPGLLELLAAQSEALHLHTLERLATPARAARKAAR